MHIFLQWLGRNWLSIFPPLAVLAAVVAVIRVVVSKKLTPPVFHFQARREKGTMSSEINILIRITSEPLGGLAGTIFKRRDIQQATVRAQCKINDSVTYDEDLLSYPGGSQYTTILANGRQYDFHLAFKQQGYFAAYLECASDIGYHTKGLLPNADIPCLVSVVDGEHTLGQVSCIIHNPDENIDNFKLECPSMQLTSHKEGSQN